jgi:hypothetical protein
MFFTFNLLAQAPLPKNMDKKEDSVIYEYKKEEYFDFDTLQIEGDLLDTIDLATKANKRIRFEIGDYTRKNFDDFTREDLIDIH